MGVVLYAPALALNAGEGGREQGGAMREAPSCMGELPCVPPHTLVNGLCRFQ